MFTSSKAPGAGSPLHETPPLAPVSLVAITGGSGSGKTWLTRRLQRRLGGSAGRLSLDDFYRDLSHLPARQRASTNFDDPGAIDWAEFRACLQGIRAGQEVQVPRYDFTTHTRCVRRRRWRRRAVVLVEGLWVLHRPEVRSLFALRVFVEAPEALRLQRRMERDRRERGRSAASILRQFRGQVAPMHDWFVEPQRRWADRIVDGARLAGAVNELADWVRGQEVTG